MILVKGVKMKVALIHYWLVNMRGGERVLEALCRLYPQADIFTHVVDKEKLSSIIARHNIYTTFIQKLPGSKKHYPKYLPLMPYALEQLDLSAYDLVISCESGPAKGVLTRAECLHVCYCHTPMRYLWDFYPEYLASSSFFVRVFMRLLSTPLRIWDVISSNRVDHFIANSHTVARRIRKHWRRDAAVVNPPVNIGAFPLSTQAREDFYVCLGQMVSYKRMDLAVAACSRLNLPLVVAGEGDCLEALKKIAGPSVRFVGRPDSAEVYRLFARCRALIFPGEEDFGIVPVEAMSAGSPVIAFNRGGATETVIDGTTGLLFDQQTCDSLCQCLQDFEQQYAAFDSSVISAHAAKYSEKHFEVAFLAQIETAKKDFDN